jgi:hypothetical protein
MKCLITFTSTGKAEPFAEAAYVVDNLDVGGITLAKLVEGHGASTRFDAREK